MGTMKSLSPLPKLFDPDFYLKNALFRKQSVGCASATPKAHPTGLCELRGQ